jgi:hypothetical protein
MRKGPAASSLANNTASASGDGTASAGKEHAEGHAATSTTAKGKDDWGEDW